MPYPHTFVVMFYFSKKDRRHYLYFRRLPNLLIALRHLLWFAVIVLIFVRKNLPFTTTQKSGNYVREKLVETELKTKLCYQLGID